MKLRTILLPVIAATIVTIIISSCVNPFAIPKGTVSADDAYQFQKVFMSSYYAEHGGQPQGLARALTPFSGSISDARATVPVGQLTKISFTNLWPVVFPNYPEPGQSTSFTANALSSNTSTVKVYDITATTTYPSTDERATYVEEYYIRDIGKDPNTGYFSATTPDGNWTYDDPIVKSDGSGGWTQDQKARIKQVLTFRDGTVRNETIISDSNAGGPKLDPSAFNINGSLDLSSAFLPAVDTTGKVQFSSVVMYYVTPSKNYNFWFWSGTSGQTILGIRYYTEVADTATSTYTAYTVAFEKVVNTLTTTGGSYTSTVQNVYAGAQWTTLAESVLRQKVVYGLNTSGSYPQPSGTGQMTTNMQTRVVNITGSSDFYLTQLNSDLAALTNATGSLYTPTGSADTILSADPTAATFTRSQQTTPATGTLPFAVQTVDTSGLGALATVYTSITEQSATVSATGGPASNLFGGSYVESFNGQQSIGTLVPGATNTLSQSMGPSGSVEAWVYISKMTDTFGIVHKGTAVNFSDECFSLQGWGSAGQIAIVLDASGTGNSYDLVTSKINLGTGAWYYVVATWDTTLGNKSYIDLYINGALNNSAKPSATANGVRSNTSDMLIGSQLPSIYSSTYGYFGLNGKIVDANIKTTADSAATVASDYNTYKGATSGW